MAYNDIRYLDVDGQMTPVGHPMYTAGQIRNLTSTIQFNIELCDTAVSAATGSVCVTSVTSKGEVNHIVIPIHGASPLGTTIHQTTSNGNLECTRCVVKHSGTSAAAYNITLSETAYAYISVFNSNVKITDYSTSGKSVTKTMVFTGDTLIEGKNYGTVTQRDALPRRKGQIFYVPVDSIDIEDELVDIQ